MAMNDQITIVTDLFERKKVKPHFINPRCFGEDFAAWLRSEIASLSAVGFELSDIIQEDWGWGFWARYGRTPFWIGLGIEDESLDAPDQPARWLLFIEYDPGLNVFKRLFHRPDARAYSHLRDAIWQALRSNRGIRVVS